MNKSIPESLISLDRIILIIGFLNYVNKGKGSIAEVGVYKGGTAHYLNINSNGKPLYLFDTFEGIPYKGENDFHKVGDFSDTSYEKVRDYFSEYESTKVIKGLFPQSANGVIREDEKFCFVHLDADQYESTLQGANYFYPKMISGGIIVFDDYNYLPSVNKAVDEFIVGKPEKIFISNQMQCFIIKQ